MLMTFTDITNQTLYVAPHGVHAICIPSPLSPGDGHCRVIVSGGVVSIVTRSEALRLVEALTSEKGEVTRG